MTRFTLADMHAANAEWGCNCGPSALAAITDMTLEEVRPHMGDFEAKHYTNPTLMFAALDSTERRWSRVQPPRNAPLTWPSYGLARIQWAGPWTKPGAPAAARYRQTHWVGAWTTVIRGIGVWDVNALGNGSGWSVLADWQRVLVPLITSEIPHASGGWHITHAIEVARP
jgi:hypothetical protein